MPVLAQLVPSWAQIPLERPTWQTDFIVKMSFLDAGISWDFGQDLEGKELGDWEQGLTTD